jgi:hypothetical protein
LSVTYNDILLTLAGTRAPVIELSLPTGPPGDLDLATRLSPGQFSTIVQRLYPDLILLGIFPNAWGSTAVLLGHQETGLVYHFDLLHRTPNRYGLNVPALFRDAPWTRGSLMTLHSMVKTVKWQGTADSTPLDSRYFGFLAQGRSSPARSVSRIVAKCIYGIISSILRVVRVGSRLINQKPRLVSLSVPEDELMKLSSTELFPVEVKGRNGLVGNWAISGRGAILLQMNLNAAHERPEYDRWAKAFLRRKHPNV